MVDSADGRELLIHREEFDEVGNPTGYALCDHGDVDVPTGLLSTKDANCERCLTFDEWHDAVYCPECVTDEET